MPTAVSRSTWTPGKRAQAGDTTSVSHEHAESAPAQDALVAEGNPVATSAVAPEMPLPLAVVSSSSPPTSLMSDRHDDQSLVEEVLKEFDPAHWLLELTTAWAAF